MKYLLTLTLTLSFACGDDDGTDFDAGGGTDAGVDSGMVDTGVDAAPEVRCEPTSSACVDEQIVQLGLFDNIAEGGIENEDLGTHWRTRIDARGGGFMTSQSYLYLRFTDGGAEKLELSDETAFDSGDWDMAFRRFVMRLNSGVSGPSCVAAGRTAADTDFDTLAAVPDGLAFRTEEYYSTPDCSVVPDGSGLGSPGTALASYWTYRSCVEMTGNVYVVQLPSGRHIKLEVETYYTPEVQVACDRDGMLPPGPSGSGNVQILWAFID
ncbi:MAG: HmuY family protein [Myxococcota bacterium]